jgi:outer membrane protein TolC
MMNLKHRVMLCAVFCMGFISIQLHADEMADEKMWATWLLESIQQLPSVKALGNRNNAAEWDYKAGKNALYNPEIEMRYEDSDAQEAGIGISQTFDFSGKRKANTKKSEASYTLAKIETQYLKEEAFSKVLHALIAYDEAESRLALVQEKERILNETRKIILTRQKAGDVSQSDINLTLLSMSENLLQIAEMEVEYNSAKSALYAILSVKEPVFSLPIESIWQSTIADVKQWVDKSPSLISAQQTISVMKAESDLFRANKKSDPTIGISATSDNDESYVGMSVSLPINVRNSYSAEYKASQERVLQAELELDAVHRDIVSQLDEKKSNYQTQLKYWKMWHSLNSSSTVKESRALIEQQWSLGDISTAEYLFLLQQHGDALLAGLKLESGLKNAWIDWLLSTQQTETWIKKIAEQKKYNDQPLEKYEGK